MQKLVVWGYESHTLLRDKSYLIWRTIILYLFENFAVATP